MRRYDFVLPTEGYVLDLLYLCSHARHSGVTSNMLSAGTSDDLCCSLTALFDKAQKKKYSLLSNFNTTISYVMCVILAQHRVLTGKRGLDRIDMLYE